MTEEQYQQWLTERGMTDADVSQRLAAHLERASISELVDMLSCPHARWDEDAIARVCLDCKRVIPRG